MCPYTGPTDIRAENGHLHIDGYPDADRLGLVESKLGSRLAGLRLHQSKLGFAEEVMQQVAGTPADCTLVRQAFVVAAAVSYFSCFGENRAVSPLSAARVFKGMPDAIDIYRYWKAIRDKYLVHDENELSFCATCLVLGKAGDVQDVMSLQIVAPPEDEDHLQLLYNLISHTKKFVDSAIDELLPRVFDEARAMSLPSRLALKPVNYRVPNPNQAVFRTRGQK